MIFMYLVPVSHEEHGGYSSVWPSAFDADRLCKELQQE